VTGASAGLGAVFADRLAREGHDLILVARNRERLVALAGQLGSTYGIQAEVDAADLSQPADLRRIERRVAEQADLDLLINNAGFGTIGPFAELDVEREEEEIRLNVVALVRLTRAALPGMIARGRGSIVNVSSMASFQPGPFNATYGATKAYVTSFTEALHEELRGSGVRVQALCPGFTRTEFQERAGIDTSDIPALAWMTSEAVVDASLAALRRGDVVFVPGVANRVVVGLTGITPRSVVRRVVGGMMRRRRSA
jgi:hypothetical protein